MVACSGGGGDAPPAGNTFRAVSLPQLAAQSAFSAAVAVNNSQVAVGTSEDASGNMKAVKWTIDRAAGSSSAATLLGPLAGNNVSAAFDINTAGTVVGQSQSGANTVPVVWAAAATTPTPLATLAAGTSGAAYNVTDGGLIVGELQIAAGGVSHAVVWTSSTATAPVDLGTLAGAGGTSAAYAVSNDGVVVVGESQNTAGASVAVFWTINPATGAVTAGPTALRQPNVDDAASIALGINSGRVIVGEVELASGEIHAVRWASPAATAVVTDMGTLGSNSSAAAINSAGRIAGWNNNGGVALAARYTVGSANATAFDRPLTDTATLSQAYGINDLNTMVGIRGSQALAIVP
jgi:uncharacterized membrane protein